MSTSKGTSLPFTTLDVFTKTKYAGNPLAVVHLDSSTTPNPLSQTQKQTIAREFNLSETCFLHLPPAQTSTLEAKDGIPIYTLDIFTTTEELPFAGHPTIGAVVHILRDLDLGVPSPTSSSPNPKATAIKHCTLALKAGNLSCSYDPLTSLATAKVPVKLHVHEATVSWDTVSSHQSTLATYFVESGEQAGGLSHFPIVSPVLGMNFVVVFLPSLEALASVSTTTSRPHVSLDEEWDVGPTFMLFYVRLRPTSTSTTTGTGAITTTEEAREAIDIRTRMIDSTVEDPATGSASIALASLIALRENRQGRTEFSMTQGVEMGRTSEIGVVVDVEGGVVKSAELRGSAVGVMEGKISV